VEEQNKVRKKGKKPSTKPRKQKHARTGEEARESVPFQKCAMNVGRHQEEAE